MPKPLRDGADPAPGLDEISTRWPLIRDPAQFVMRYAPAIRKYLEALLHNSHDAEDVVQDFLIKGLLRGFVRTENLRGRFRHYLKRAVRNAAINHMRHQSAHRTESLSEAPSLDPHDHDPAADRQWLAEWRGCLLDRTLQALDHYQRQTPGNLFHTAVRLTFDYPDESADELANRAGVQVGRSVRGEAFRKQLSRARRKFAELLRDEVQQTLERPTAEHVMEELAELGLLAHVQDYLSAE